MAILVSPWHVISSAALFIIGLLLVAGSRKTFNLTLRRVLLLYLWHTGFCMFYLWFSINYRSDAVDYFQDASSGVCGFSLGTDAIRFMTCALIALDLSYFGCFLVFNFFGVIGLIAFDSALKEVAVCNSRRVRFISSLFVFLPSISYWSSALGKDAVAFMSVGLALWSAIKLDRRVMTMIISIFIMLLVRPHVAGMLVIALGVAILFNENAKPVFIIGLTCVLALAAAVLMPFALTYVGFDQGDGLSAYVEKRQGYNLGYGGSLDISKMSFPLQLFTYIFRPLPYEAHNLFAFVTSIENVALLVLCMSAAASKLRVFQFFSSARKTRGADLEFILPRGVYYFSFTYVLIAWPLMAVMTSNLGIATRQKWMFLPILVFVAFSLFNRKKCNYKSR
ncbi:MAG: hypothetical protein KUG81_01565 [Gammaproteobacteria bacterium]|nr:hypothetical protein [Gammaproteobacteria bacterium]